MYKQFANSKSSCALFILVCEDEWACTGGVGTGACVFRCMEEDLGVFVFRVGVEGLHVCGSLGDRYEVWLLLVYGCVCV